MMGPLIQLDSSSLGTGTRVACCEQSDKAAMNMGNYMSQELQDSQRELLNAVSQLGMMYVGIGVVWR